MQYWQKNRHTGQCNTLEVPEVDPHKYSQLVFDKGAKAIQWRKDSLSKSELVQLDIHTYLTPYIKIHSKQITGLNVK